MRRPSVTRILRKLSKASPSEAQDPSTPQTKRPTSSQSETTKPNLTNLPTELQMSIIQYLPLPTLCSLRLTNQVTNALLSTGDIPHSWLKTNVSPLQRHLYPPPNPPTFTHLLEQHHRLHIASNLSLSLGHYVQHHILIYLRLDSRPLPSLLNAIDEIWHPREGKIVPLLLILQHYLETLSDLWQTLPTQPIPAPRTFSDEFARREREIFSTRAYSDTDLLHDAHRLWLFLCWTTKQLLNRPSYVGTIERGLRGWTESPVTDEDFNRYVIFANLRGLLALLNMRSYRERRRAVNDGVASLSPGHNPTNWRESWKGLSLRMGDLGPDILQAEGVMAMGFVGHGLVWTRCAHEALVERGMEQSREVLVSVGTARQTLSFLKEVAGYSFIQTPTPIQAVQVLGGDDGQGDASAD